MSEPRDERLHDARRRLAQARIHNAAARDAGVPVPWPVETLAELEQAVVDLTGEQPKSGAGPRTG